MKRPLMLTAFASLILVLVGAGTVRPQGGVTARANQHPANQSGVMGRITFTQTGGGLIITGTAKGLAPSTAGRYVSLVYDTASVPGGPTLCEPVVPFPDMFVGIWISDAAGNGLLFQVAQPSPLGTFDTVSIRDTTINDGFGPEAVVACGQVAINP
ncbi:MAG TPA: hypothetical protein VKN18_08005 [Blastocatellia bacterium]|nr:hypothetical protein [Blastocatellia bacterium]